jgi:hypothetical protein
MRQLGLANTVTEAAIRARLASDRDVNNSLVRIYENLVRSGMSSPRNQQQPQTPPSESFSLLPEERLFPQPTVQR